MIQVWLALLGLMLTFGLMLAAQGAWRAKRPVVAATPPQARPTTAPVPIADMLPAVDGSTGTVALPDLPIPPGANIADRGVVAARPFAWGRASAIDRARAMQCLTAAIYYEAGGESIDGQRAVAQVVLNRARHPAFPATVCGVVYQGSSAGIASSASHATARCRARPRSRAGRARRRSRRRRCPAASMRRSDWRRITTPSPSLPPGTAPW